MIELIYQEYENNRMIFIIGNGGSASKASHLAQDLSKAAISNQDTKKRIKTISMTDNIPYITVFANDTGYENIFSSQLRTFANEGDLLIAIRVSVNSQNILNAKQFVKKFGVKIIRVTGYNGGKLHELSDISINVPINDIYI